jgi:Kef-type K+ transport system membrane component KefB
LFYPNDLAISCCVIVFFVGHRELILEVNCWAIFGVFSRSQANGGMTRMDYLDALSPEVRWTLGLIVAWLSGEFAARWAGLPRISIYALLGFLLGPSQLGVLPSTDSSGIYLLAEIGFALVLFEFGYHINLAWLRSNLWLSFSGLLAGGATAALGYTLARWYEISQSNSLLIAALAMASSPAGVMSVVNETRSAGQVTERVLHLCFILSVLSTFACMLIPKFSRWYDSGVPEWALLENVLLLAGSLLLGIAFSVVLPFLLRRLKNLAKDGTVVFALAVVLIVVLAEAMEFSVILASLSFGVATRYRRLHADQARRNFGVLGELLGVLLFVVVASKLHWRSVWTAWQLGLIAIAGRLLMQTAAVMLFAPISGISWRKGLWSGLALSPFSVLVIFLIDQGRDIDTSLGDEVSGLGAMLLGLHIVGPIFCKGALVCARETSKHTPH